MIVGKIRWIKSERAILDFNCRRLWLRGRDNEFCCGLRCRADGADGSFAEGNLNYLSNL